MINYIYNDFRFGDKVECIDDLQSILRKGRVYEVAFVEELDGKKYVTLVGDKSTTAYGIERFVLVEA